MTIMNIILIGVVVVGAIILIMYFITKKKNAAVEESVDVDDKTYTLEKMTEFVKRRLDEITKVKSTN